MSEGVHCAYRGGLYACMRTLSFEHVVGLGALTVPGVSRL